MRRDYLELYAVAFIFHDRQDAELELSIIEAESGSDACDQILISKHLNKFHDNILDDRIPCSGRSYSITSKKI